MTEEYIIAENRIEKLLEELISEVKNQGELNRINNTVLVSRLKEKD